MLRQKKAIIYFFRYLWLLLAVLLVFYIISQAIITERTLVYKLDFSQQRTRNIDGWYPIGRVAFSQEQQQLNVLGEPIYLKVYSPVNFKNLIIQGDLRGSGTELKLGLRQKDGSWQWQPLVGDKVNLSFPLDQAQIKRNELELILAAPALTTTSTLWILNNWQIILQR